MGHPPEVPMPKMQAPFYPLIYVRGYAGTRDGVDDTTADPFCGFNLGSTVYRAVSDKDRPARKSIFESPLVRLASEFDYLDVYEDGYDIVDKEWSADAQGKPTGRKLGSRSIVIYRYYDEASRLLGSGKTPPIETFARGLGDLVLAVRDLACANPDNETTPETFKCYLVAHSMGGLVCRAFLQNPALDAGGAHRYVDKFFTYATPHNGIDFGGVNVPSWLSAFDINNFDRDKRMPEYLDLVSAYRKHKRADLIPESRLPTSRIFCMVGTNRIDYQTAAGLSRTFVGHGSDGLVRIENATLSGLDADGAITGECAKAFAFRAHSGYFGIVNSEEAFQNLIRFLFGDVRVDVWLDIEDIRLPAAVQKEADAGREIDALYQVELLAAPRGKLWNLTRRIAEEDSVACIAQSEWRERPSHYLSSVFLADRARVNRDSPWLAYSLMLGVRVPDYEVEKKLWMNEHFEGSYLFRNEVVLQMIAPANPQGKWQAKYAWQNGGVAAADTAIDLTGLDAGRLAISIPFESVAVAADGTQQPATPGIKGKVRLVVSAWNTPG
jgi:hypothetical protein